MALDTNFNINPYYDDFDSTKNYLRLLFKPGYAVQSRELTQIQSALQDQVEKFGKHVFRNGSVVTGGQFYLQDATYLKLDTTYSGTDILYTDFVGKTITSIDETKRAEVIKVYDADQGTGDPITLMVKPVYGEAFTSGESIKTKEETSAYATISTSGVGTGQVFSVNEGVFYYEGFFISNDFQTVATTKYTNDAANVRIGFEIEESIVSVNSDTSLLDPAQYASNYQAPGADRYQISLILSTRTLESTDDTKFIELARVENGELAVANQYPLYSVLEDTLARRTYDESGNYAVKPFKLNIETNTSNTAQTNITLSPGKAYVYGYEFETNSPTTISVDKPRTTSNVNNKRVPSDYGSFIYTTNHFGSYPINSLSTIDLHCVNIASINTTSTTSISNTKIGTARIKSLSFDSASNTSNGQTYQYKTFLFDVNVGSITGTVNTATSSTVVIGNTAAGQVFSTVTNAYTGAKLRIVSGPGSDESPKTITGFTGSTQTVSIDSPFVTTPNSSSTFAIDFEFNDLESLANFSSTTMVSGSNVSELSKDSATTYSDVILTDTSLEPLIFSLGENYISQNSISDLSFSYRRLYQNQSFSGSLSPTLSTGTGEDLSTGSSSTSKLQNYYITVTDAGTSPYSVGDVVPIDKFTVDNLTNRITVTSGNNMVANIVATIDVSTISQKTKTFVEANTTVQTSGGVDVFGDSSVISYDTTGQCHISSEYITRTANENQSLFVSDVVEVTQILDFTGNNVTVSNSAFAVDVTSKYTLDNGQRDSYYDHSSIRLKSSTQPPVGPIVVFYNRFNSSGSGYFTVDSYGIDYENIPTYTSSKDGSKYFLRDCIDFRPVRQSATSGSGTSVVFDVDASTFGPKIPENTSDILLDYAYYLPRIDKVVLDKTRRFEVIKGIPSLTPVMPQDNTTSMTLFILAYPPYVTDTKEITVQQVNHRRYTMKDIGSIEKRVENLEYYTSLSLLEQETVNKRDLSILDTQNLPRFKNGIIVDSFVGHSVANVYDSDYAAAIDPINKELRPSFNISSSRLKFDEANSSNFLLTGSLLSANSTSVSFISQPKASKASNINPFSVVNYLGKIKLSPQSDIWVDTETKPDVLVNIGGDRDAWDMILDAAGVSNFNYEWNSWNTVWTGVQVQEAAWIGQGPGGNGIRIMGTDTIITTTQQARTGTASMVSTQTITQSIGDRVVDVSIIPYMREINVLFVGTDFKPNQTLYPFFDNTPVQKYVGNRVNKFYLANNNIGFNTNLSNPEVLSVVNKDTSTEIGEALVVHTSNNIVYVTNVTADATFNVANIKIVGAQTNLEYNVTRYEHLGGLASGGTANTITFRTDAAGVGQSNTYVGSTIYIPQGAGQGQSATITSYNASTKVATVTPNWTTVPVADDTAYAIGNLKSDQSGSVVGLYTIPNGTFRIGEKLFRLVDNSDGDIPSSSTNGDASFYAQGILQTTEETIVSTIAPTIQRTSVTESRVLTTRAQGQQRVVGWYDPLAQTYLISPEQYPEGIFVSKLRFCFKSKDDVIPITLQLRPTVNGYPSSTVIYPFSSLSLTPDKVKVTDSPDLDDPTKYTEFVFDSPVYMQPGEHAFVLWSNSNKYEAYTAEVGKLDLTTSRQISEQPYGGSLFISQNGTTWTADQNSDMMFRIYRSDFASDTVVAEFNVETPSEAFNYSTVQLINSDINLAGTTIDYEFNSEIASGGFAGYSYLTPKTDYSIKDSYGERVLNPETGNTTFVLRGTLQTETSAISPIVDVSRLGIITVGHRINNLPLSNSGIVVANTGSGYANSSDITVTISGGGGTGATAVANVVANTVDAVYIVDGGSGYYATPTITLTPGSGGGSNATVTYNGETDASGGNSIARYITRKVTLADGFDSGDLRVYITANKPSGTNIHVYYKILSISDPENFELKKWTPMTQLGNSNFVSLNDTDFRELTFAPGTDGIPSDSVTYTSGDTAYSTFRTFAVKVVMSSSSPAIVPRAKDLRVIALPAA